MEPLSKDDTDRTKALRVLLRGVCLRRDESYLKLPDPVHQVVATCFDAREKELYDGVLKTSQRDLDDVVSGQSKAKKYAVLFAAIMKLRRLCNHGTLLTSESMSNSNPSTPGLLESSCEYCQGNQEESLAALNKDTVCPECGRSLQRAQVPGPLTPKLGASRTSTPDTFFGVEQLRGKSPMVQLTDGSSSKLLRVVEALRQTNREGKSLVFSYWTSTLDLLKQMLLREQMPFLSIDGRVLYKERPVILEQFRTDERIPILLMSIQTGAVGLNLTAANFVHIVEPQWNPSVEEQAIGRALRMGQTRTVTVFRYVMQSSIEQNIQTLQKKKRNLAKFTLDGSGTESGTLEDFKFMLDM
ncbi:hypothetical protein KJ359_007094 [Pestalotiopsis sp. 9143b]|nr:hypothetical protein KJ359_007094 [Pestalotiopsis sp. 9143b]